MRPLDQTSARTTRDLNLLAQRYREPLPLPSQIGLVNGTLKPGAQALLGDLIYSRPYGNGMVLLGISPDVQQGVQGVLIIVAVALSLDHTRLKIVK